MNSTVTSLLEHLSVLCFDNLFSNGWSKFPNFRPQLWGSLESKIVSKDSHGQLHSTISLWDCLSLKLNFCPGVSSTLNKQFKHFVASSGGFSFLSFVIDCGQSLRMFSSISYGIILSLSGNFQKIPPASLINFVVNCLRTTGGQGNHLRFTHKIYRSLAVIDWTAYRALSCFRNFYAAAIYFEPSRTQEKFIINKAPKSTVVTKVTYIPQYNILS